MGNVRVGTQLQSVSDDDNQSTSQLDDVAGMTSSTPRYTFHCTQLLSQHMFLTAGDGATGPALARYSEGSGLELGLGLVGSGLGLGLGLVDLRNSGLRS